MAGLKGSGVFATKVPRLVSGILGRKSKISKLPSLENVVYSRDTVRGRNTLCVGGVAVKRLVCDSS